MVRDKSKADRDKLNDAILSRPGQVDEKTGLRAPSWWHGEEDAAEAAQGFMGTMGRR